MRNNRSLIDFNKELIFGEIGSIICAPLFASITSMFSSSTDAISNLAVLGAVFGACLFWILTRIYDQKKQKSLSVKKMAKDIAFFTPAAFIITLLVYYPAIKFGSKYLLDNGEKVLSSVVTSQIIGFLVFLLAINIYRYALSRFFGKKI